MKSKLIFKDVIKRLKSELNITQDNVIAEVLGMTPGAFHARKKADSLPIEEILLLSNQKNINLNWLLWGSHQVSNAQKIDESSNNLRYIDSFAVTNLTEFSLIPFYDVEASAGHGALVDQEHKLCEMAFRKDWLRLKGLEVAHCALIKARGDSMEPTLHDGDLLLIDTRFDAIKDDSIYILQADSHLIVKRVQLSLDGSLDIISDNPRYDKQTISAEETKEIKVIGRLRWYGHEI